MYMPELHSGVFVFRRLSASSDNVNAYLTLGWRITDDQSEPWTARFNAFKWGNQRAVRGACVAVPPALRQAADVLGPSVTVVAAHGHADLTLNTGSGVAQLAAAIAAPYNWHFEPRALHHVAHEQLSRATSLEDREARISGTYTCAVAPATERVLIVDDFVTNGSTIREIASAIQAAAPAASVYGLALGKSERVSWAQRYDHNINNLHIPTTMATAWDSV